ATTWFPKLSTDCFTNWARKSARYARTQLPRPRTCLRKYSATDECVGRALLSAAFEVGVGEGSGGDCGPVDSSEPFWSHKKSKAADKSVRSTLLRLHGRESGVDGQRDMLPEKWTKGTQ